MAALTTEQLDELERDLMARLRQVYGDERWILAGEVAQGIAGGVLVAQKLGAHDAIAIASRTGVGLLPDAIRMIISGDSHVGDDASLVERMHDSNRELHNLPAWIIDQVDEWDPEKAARVIAAFTVDAGLIADRPTFGARKPEWAELEDKIVIRDIWDSTGIETAPDRVIELSDLAALRSAHAELATRWGCVWAADNDQGWHGGGDGTRWVSNEQQIPTLAAELAVRHTRVRVQPFLEGVPCSIHGMVLRDATLAFRPCEMLVLLDTERNEFEYSRAATFWDPSQAARDQMRNVAKTIGDELRARVDFRGVFTVDGVLTTDGFRPTEVNPRFGAALPPRLPTSAGEELPVFFTHLAAVTGHLDDFDPARLESLLLDRLDRNRMGGGFIRTPHGPPGDQLQIAIGGHWTGSEFVDLYVIDEGNDDQRPAITTAAWGPDPSGGLIFTTFTDNMPVGPAVAPTIVAIRAFLDEHWKLGLRNLRPAFAY